MEIRDSKFQDELEIASEAAEKAGEIMDNYREEEIEVKDTKTDKTDIVTQTDEDAQEVILKTIKQSFSNDNFLGEEDLTEDNGNDRTWVIDPIDGTFNFQKGHEYFCTSIALEIDGETKVAVVYSPESGLNELFYAVEGEGAYLRKSGENRKLKVSDQDQLTGSLLELTMITRMSDDRKESSQNIIAELREKEVRYIKQGCLVLSGCKIAQGVFDGAIQYGWKWDFAAAKLIQKEAGAEVRHREKKSGELDETVTSNGKIQRELEKLLDKSKP
jgi:myo-inositol-1(or 4)-monophosphatase